MTYYSAIIAWAAYYFGASFKWPFPWATEDCGVDAECLADPARALPLPTSDSYFTDTVLQSNDSSLADGVARIFSGPLVGCAPPLTRYCLGSSSVPAQCHAASHIADTNMICLQKEHVQVHAIIPCSLDPHGAHDAATCGRGLEGFATLQPCVFNCTVRGRHEAAQGRTAVAVLHLQSWLLGTTGQDDRH